MIKIFNYKNTKRVEEKKRKNVKEKGRKGNEKEEVNG
jgi:hypothetical protein